jgi:hypothetical protein
MVTRPKPVPVEEESCACCEASRLATKTDEYCAEAEAANKVKTAVSIVNLKMTLKNLRERGRAIVGAVVRM